MCVLECRFLVLDQGRSSGEEMSVFISSKLCPNVRNPFCSITEGKERTRGTCANTGLLLRLCHEQSAVPESGFSYPQSTFIRQKELTTSSCEEYKIPALVIHACILFCFPAYDYPWLFHFGPVQSSQFVHLHHDSRYSGCVAKILPGIKCLPVTTELHIMWC